MYIADLHIHSRYSRATSRDLTPEKLELEARKKGIRLLGTGDFTHPAWRRELFEKLVPAEEGLYRLKKESVQEPGWGGEEGDTRFVVSGEISSIYKQGGKVRKVHSLILLPGLEEAQRLSERLEAIGNIHSDGRPILGLSCHDLLEIMLDICPEGIFIPAHIWTPHFSLFGAFSGFDTVEECFGELASYIHSVETGLSSDPPMNWQLSALDGYQLISNSDAHSPGKLGREANLLEGDLSYANLQRAIETGEGLAGTIEFFPEEGKYHFDGHRKCHICFSPQEAEQAGGICPVCQKKLTMGVSHRIAQLADRPLGYQPEGRKPFESLVPLTEVIAASTGRSAASKKVQQEYCSMLEQLGPEFAVLREIPIQDIEGRFGHLIGEGIRRLRAGQVTRLPGFDGEYGTIKLFEPDEIKNPEGQMSISAFLEESLEQPLTDGKNEELEEASGQAREVQTGKKKENTEERKAAPDLREKSILSEKTETGGADFLMGLNARQRQAAEMSARSLAVIAGPGTGKTGTLAARIRCLIEKRRVKPSEITAVTFTNKAAGELKTRLQKEMPHGRSSSLVQTGTFHSVCFRMLRQAGAELRLGDPLELTKLASQIIQEQKLSLRPSAFLRRVSEEKIKEALITENREEDQREFRENEAAEKEGTGKADGKTENKRIEKETGNLEEQETARLQRGAALYRQRLKSLGISDFDDLLIQTLTLLREEQKEVRRYCSHFRYLLVDEFQDISPLQYELVRQWNRDGRELFLIGDPDQSIYGFRGSDPQCFAQVQTDYPYTEVIRLEENYRSTASIIGGACGLISHNPGLQRSLIPAAGFGIPVKIVVTDGKRSEGIYTAREINRMIGGIDMLDAQERQPEEKKVRSFSDIGVLCRTNRQTEAVEEYLKTEGIPYIVTGRGTFLEEKTVRDALGFFRDQTSAVGKKKPEGLIRAWMKEQGLTGDKALQKLADMAVFHKTMEGFLENLIFGEEGDLRRCGAGHYTADAVSLMTLHGAKGLEFPAVIILGLRKHSIPLEYVGEDRLEEERRLLYVGMTRAKEELILLTYGEESVFLKEIPESFTEREKAAGDRTAAVKQMSLFDFL